MANTVTSTTGTVADSTVTFTLDGVQESVILLLKYDKGNGTSVSVAPTVISNAISTTDQYAPIYLSADEITINTQTFGTSTTGNYRVSIAIGVLDNTLKAAVTFTGGTTQTLVMNILRL